MRKLVPLLLLWISSSCAPTFLISQEEVKSIPKGTKKILVDVPYSQDQLLSNVAKYFSREGYQVNTDKTAMQVSTGFKSIEGGATVRMVAFVDSVSNNSRLYLSGEWGLNTDGQAAMKAFSGATMSGASNAIIYDWNMGGTKPGIAFQHMVLAAKAVPDGVITYSP